MQRTKHGRLCFQRRIDRSLHRFLLGVVVLPRTASPGSVIGLSFDCFSSGWRAYPASQCLTRATSCSGLSRFCLGCERVLA
jgi:hypothetical protein